MWQVLVAPHRKAMDVGDYTMQYIDIGQGEPVVMVHGFSLCAYTWRNSVEVLLDAGFRVILVDLPGHGQTEIPSQSHTYTVEQIASDILSLIQKLKLERFNLVGHSLGAGLTLFMSIHYPQFVRKAVVIDPPAFGPPRRMLLTYPGMTTMASLFFSKWTVKLYMKAMYFDKSLINDEIVDEYARQTQKDGYWSMLSALSREYFSHQFFDMQSAYGSMATPLCIIWGEQDAWLPRDIAKKFHEQIPNSQLNIVPDSGHNPHEECPERVNPVVVEFLTKHD